MTRLRNMISCTLPIHGFIVREFYARIFVAYVIKIGRIRK